MIAYLRGNLARKTPGFVWIEAGGVGYEVRISLQTFSSLPDEGEVSLFTHFHVREDAQLLYGFKSEGEKSIFLHLISISGVGPNTALMVLSSLSVAELHQALISQDVAVIKAVKGIGQKTAERIILELKDKLSLEGQEGTSNIPSISNNTLREEALSALSTLGYTKSAADKGISQAIKALGGDASLEEVIKWVLKSA